MFKNWGTRDWVWLSSYFIVIIILLLANFYWDWETNLSIISSATSIALAVLAIFLALKQDSENKISTDSKHIDLSKQLRDLNTVLLSKQAGIENVVTNVEETLNVNKVENDKKESYSHEQLKEYGEKIKKETIELFKKELNNQVLNDLDRIGSNSNVSNDSYNEYKRREKNLIKSYIEMVGEYTTHDVVAHLKSNGIFSSEARVRTIIRKIIEERNN